MDLGLDICEWSKCLRRMIDRFRVNKIIDDDPRCGVPDVGIATNQRGIFVIF